MFATVCDDQKVLKEEAPDRKASTASMESRDGSQRSASLHSQRSGSSRRFCVAAERTRSTDFDDEESRRKQQYSSNSNLLPFQPPVGFSTVLAWGEALHDSFGALKRRLIGQIVFD